MSDRINLNEIAELLARGFLRLYGRGKALIKIDDGGAHGPADPPEESDQSTENVLDLSGPRSVHRHDG